MVTKEQIKKEVDNLPENLLDEVHGFLISIAEKNNREESVEETRKRWDAWWKNLENFSPDFMNERIQPPLETRQNMFD
ncbi:MAG: hypothetical protein KF856_09985 [Cyclobacteriaceae bacterium]|nr:hypothetical protein [Cyclobacteriaceae bacterium]